MSERETASAMRKAIERTYRERGRGFLAWARRHAPDRAGRSRWKRARIRERMREEGPEAKAA